jgi:hypothetical protein
LEEHIAKATEDLLGDYSEPKNITRKIENAAQEAGQLSPPPSYLEKVVRAARQD